MRRRLLFVLMCLTTLLAGCGDAFNERNEFEDIFNGNNENVFAPVRLYSDENSGAGRMNVSEALIRSAYREGLEHNGVSWEEAKNRACAVVLNDASLLNEEWPEIDFHDYSLVLGMYGYVGGSFLLFKGQRAVVSDGKTMIYLRFVKDTAPNYGQTCDVRLVYFCAMYTKLPGGLAEIIKWVDDTSSDLSY